MLFSWWLMREFGEAMASDAVNADKSMFPLDNQVFSNLLIFSERIIEKINELRSFYVKIDGIYQKTWLSS